MKKQTISHLILFSLLILLISCTSSTRFVSDPPGAVVYMNGQAVGETPYVHEDSKISFSKTLVTLEKEGYEDENIVLRKDEEVDMGAVVGGIFFQWPFIWTFGYMPEHYYVLSPEVSIVENENGISQKQMDQLSDLNEMYKDGIIDDREFDRLKAKILKKGIQQ